MLYLIVNRKDFQKLILPEQALFTEIENKILYNRYMFVNYIGDDKKCREIIYDNNVHCLVVNPYISSPLYRQVFKADKDNEAYFTKRYMEESLFEILMASYADSRPHFKKDFLLLSGPSPEKDIEDIYLFNSFLKSNKLLINLNNIRPTLTEIFNNSRRQIVEEEVWSEIIKADEINDVNTDYFALIVAEFIIKASKQYPRDQIETFLKKEFHNFLEIP